MHTKDKLAAALTEVGLAEMAAQAATGYYHDYLSPLATPTLQLVNDLGKVGTPAAAALRGRVMEGDCDASAEEGEEWAASAEGQEAFSRLTKKSN
jgi:hypothetical protein